jgi:hypothetical protein
MITERGNPMMCHKSKNILIRLCTVWMLCTFLLLSMPIAVLAAGSTSISLSSRSLSKGETLTVTVVGSSSSSLSLKYDNTMLQLVDSGHASANGNVLTISAASVTYKFKAIQAGNAGIVVSSDQLSGSSLFVPIAEAAETTEEEVKEEKKETTSEKKEDTSNQAKAVKEEKKDKKDKKKSSSSTGEKEKKKNAEQVTVQQTKKTFTSEDLSFKELITDRRMVAVLILLVAVILVLVIQLILRGHEETDYDDEPISIDDKFFEPNPREEERPAVPSHTHEKETKIVTDHNMADLTMPRAPKSAGQKLEVMDLNDL